MLKLAKLSEKVLYKKKSFFEYISFLNGKKILKSLNLWDFYLFIDVVDFIYYKPLVSPAMQEIRKRNNI